MAYERDFKGVWISKKIWLDEKLGWSEKLLLVEIDSLDNEQGCYAGNKHFAEFFGLSLGRISKMVSNLKEKGYITVDLIYKEGSKQIDKRVIRVLNTYSRKDCDGIDENNHTPLVENSQDNNTSLINNTININNTVTSEEVTEVKQSKSEIIKEQALRVYEFYVGLTNSRITPSATNLKEVIARLKANELTEENCYEILKFKYAQAVKQDNFQYFTLISLFRKGNSANTMQQIELMEVNKPMQQEFNQPYKKGNKEEVDWSRL